MRAAIGFALALALAACSRSAPAPTAASVIAPAATSNITTLGDATLRSVTVRLSALNPEMAQRYGIDQSQDGVLLLVTLRNAGGDAIAPADLKLDVRASVLPDPLNPLALRSIQINDMTDYIGVVPARPPATVQFKLEASRGGARASLVTLAELTPP